MTTAVDRDFNVRTIDGTFMMQVFAFMAGMALLSLLIFVTGTYYGRTIAMAGHTDDTSRREIIIGNNVIYVPANMLRHERQRYDGVQAKLDLYARWPDMKGYSSENADDFNNVGNRRNIIYLTFQERMMSRDMSGRVDPIYRELIVQPGISGPNGLTMYGFRENSGYLNELLFIGKRGNQSPFAARCLAGKAAERSLASCERDIQVGDNLTLTYRFSKEVLTDWRRLDASVVAMANKLIR